MILILSNTCADSLKVLRLALKRNVETYFKEEGDLPTGIFIPKTTPSVIKGNNVAIGYKSVMEALRNHKE